MSDFARVSDNDLAAFYFSAADEDPQGERARGLIDEAARRGLTRKQLLALWNAQQ